MSFLCRNRNNTEKLWEIVSIVGREKEDMGWRGELQFGRRECDREKNETDGEISGAGGKM